MLGAGVSWVVGQLRFGRSAAKAALDRVSGRGPVCGGPSGQHAESHSPSVFTLLGPELNASRGGAVGHTIMVIPGE